jgi:hypothetical protein
VYVIREKTLFFERVSMCMLGGKRFCVWKGFLCVCYKGKYSVFGKGFYVYVTRENILFWKGFLCVCYKGKYSVFGKGFYVYVIREKILFLERVPMCML